MNFFDPGPVFFAMTVMNQVVGFRNNAIDFLNFPFLDRFFIWLSQRSNGGGRMVLLQVSSINDRNLLLRENVPSYVSSTTRSTHRQ
mmetsp:Transcript_25271/g.59888  ORF Transcript_25271/g.59888 Transcript_25271/m.59888 type:complete len:86 (-) Transcript_25271:1613-1870(-)